MQEQPNGERPRKDLPGLVYKPTGTKYVAQRGGKFMVRWVEHGHRYRRSFSTYAAACAFVRDYIIPFKKKESPLPPSAIAPAKGEGWVYMFRSAGPNQPVKIGWSTDPAKRLKYLATGHPYRIDLVALLPGTKGLERALHNQLEEYRLEGEWFSREVESVVTKLIAIAIRPAMKVAASYHLKPSQSEETASTGIFSVEDAA